MRFNNEIVLKNLKTGEESSETNSSGESLDDSSTEPIINNVSVNNHNFSWNLQPRCDFGKAQTFSALCYLPENQPTIDSIIKNEDIPSPR
jgi:hypothetical protein